MPRSLRQARLPPLARRGWGVKDLMLIASVLNGYALGFYGMVYLFERAGKSRARLIVEVTALCALVGVAVAVVMAKEMGS